MTSESANNDSNNEETKTPPPKKEPRVGQYTVYKGSEQKRQYNRLTDKL